MQRPRNGTPIPGHGPLQLHKDFAGQAKVQNLYPHALSVQFVGSELQSLNAKPFVMGLGSLES